MTGISLLKRHFFLFFWWPAINILVAVWSCYLLCKIGNLIFWRASHSSILEDNLNDSWQDFISLKLSVLTWKEPRSGAPEREQQLGLLYWGSAGDWGRRQRRGVRPPVLSRHIWQPHIPSLQSSPATHCGQQEVSIYITWPGHSGHYPRTQSASQCHNHNRTYFYAGVSREMRVQCNV